ncbi:MAG: hypothetical protein QW222_07720 [Candidatus Bathyarchaeia archaeon]
MNIRKDISSKSHGISPIISTIIISGTLLVILVIASFVATNLLELQVANTEFEQAKANMLLLDEVIQNVALRQGSGRTVQFNQRSGGIGITETPISIKITAPTVQNSSATLKPNANGDFQQWKVVPDDCSHWAVLADGNDNTYINASSNGLIDIQNIEDPPFDDEAKIYYINITVRTRTLDSGNVNIGIYEKLGSSTRQKAVAIGQQWNNYSIILYSATDGGNWTRQKIADLQVGVRSTSNKKCQVSEIWVIVSYKPLKEIYQSSNLTYVYYRAGSKVSGTEKVLRGSNSLCADIEDALGFLRIESDNGLKIKLDYFRVRIVTNTTLLLGNFWYNITEITFLKLIKGPTSGSEIVSVKVQNLGVNTYTRLYDTSEVLLKVEIGGETKEIALKSPSGWRTAVIFTEILMEISTS